MKQAENGGLMLPSGEGSGFWIYDRRTRSMVDLDTKTSVPVKKWESTVHLQPANKRMLAEVDHPLKNLLMALGSSGYPTEQPRKKLSSSVWEVDTPFGNITMLSSQKDVRIKTFRSFLWNKVRKQFI
jgi:hypothetical protein